MVPVMYTSLALVDITFIVDGVVDGIMEAVRDGLKDR